MSDERLSREGVIVGSVPYDWKPSFLPPLYAALPSKLQKRHDLVYRFDQSLFALSNNDVRSALLLFGVNTIPSRMSAILDRMSETFPPGTWIPSDSVARLSYARRFFCPTAVTYELERDGQFDYRTTQEGEEFTKDVAAHFIRYAAAHDLPVSKVFGEFFPTRSGASRPYINRTATLLALSKAPSSEIRFVNAFNLRSSVVGGTFKALRDIGFISYDYPDMETKGWAEYEKVGQADQVVHSPTLDRLRRNVIKYFELNPMANTQTLAQVLDREDESDISAVLGDLVNCGYLRRPWHASVAQSDARIAPKGEEFVDEVLLPTLLASAKDVGHLRRLRDSRDAVEGSPEMAAHVIGLYRANRTRISADLTSIAIVDFIQTEGPTRAIELREEFGGRAEPIFAGLAARGTLAKYRIGRATYYLLPGMPLPEHTVAIRIFEYHQPSDLIPPIYRSKEEYRADLETVEFWRRLLTDVQSVAIGVVTDREFFHYYDPTNAHWQEKDNHKRGKYDKYYEALRRLGIKQPYTFIREYRPKSRNNKLRTAVAQVQTAIAERFILSKPYKSWEDYVAQLNTESFWATLLADVQAAPKGLGMHDFLNHYSREHTAHYDPSSYGPYANLYQMAEIHLQQGTSLLWNFVPNNRRAGNLRRLVAETQTILREKFVLRPHRMQPEDWLRAFDSPDFWEEFRKDIGRFQGKDTFGNFLFYFDESNRDLSKKKASRSKPYLGKYYRIPLIFSSSKHLYMLEQAAELADAPKGLLPAEIVRWFLYKKAPGNVKDNLLAKFPDEFNDIDNTIIGVSQKPSLSGAISTPASENTSKIVVAIDALASTTLDQKKALLAFYLWDQALYATSVGSVETTSENALNEIGRILGINTRIAKAYIDKAITDTSLEDALERLLEN